MRDDIRDTLLELVSGIHGVPKGAYNIRLNSKLDSRASTPNIRIESKTDKSGIDIYITTSSLAMMRTSPSWPAAVSIAAAMKAASITASIGFSWGKMPK